MAQMAVFEELIAYSSEYLYIKLTYSLTNSLILQQMAQMAGCNARHLAFMRITDIVLTALTRAPPRPPIDADDRVSASHAGFGRLEARKGEARAERNFGIDL